MTNQALIHHMVTEPELVTPMLFKPVQFKILQKLDQCQPLTNNEQRYLRGKLGKKLQALDKLLSIKQPEQELAILLNTIGSYYITGLEALKHNGYGWFFEPKIMEIINTKIQGKIVFQEKTVRFIRIKSLSRRKFSLEAETGLRYADNDQIRKDVVFTKNKYTKYVWMQMYQRYGNVFSTLKLPIPEEEIDFTQYEM